MLKYRMSENEMQSYADNKEGYHVEFLFEYAKELGYYHRVLSDGTNEGEYLFYKPLNCTLPELLGC